MIAEARDSGESVEISQKENGDGVVSAATDV
jgi:hypothetical protein